MYPALEPLIETREARQAGSTDRLNGQAQQAGSTGRLDRRKWTDRNAIRSAEPADACLRLFREMCNK